jgi:hypothetical protein
MPSETQPEQALRTKVLGIWIEEKRPSKFVVGVELRALSHKSSDREPQGRERRDRDGVDYDGFAGERVVRQSEELI